MIDPEMIEARVEPSSNLIAKDATFSPCLSLMPLIEPTMIPTVPKLAKLTK